MSRITRRSFLGNVGRASLASALFQPSPPRNLRFNTGGGGQGDAPANGVEGMTFDSTTNRLYLMGSFAGANSVNRLYVYSVTA